MDLSDIDPPSRVLNYCFTIWKQSSSSSIVGLEALNLLAIKLSFKDFYPYHFLNGSCHVRSFSMRMFEPVQTHYWHDFHVFQKYLRSYYGKMCNLQNSASPQTTSTFKSRLTNYHAWYLQRVWFDVGSIKEFAHFPANCGCWGIQPARNVFPVLETGTGIDLSSQWGLVGTVNTPREEDKFCNLRRNYASTFLKCRSVSESVMPSAFTANLDQNLLSLKYSFCWKLIALKYFILFKIILFRWTSVEQLTNLCTESQVSQRMIVSMDKPTYSGRTNILSINSLINP